MRTGSSPLRLVTIADRPDLDHVVATWLWETFARENGHPFEPTLLEVRCSITTRFMPRTFILLDNATPVGTASLTEQDLDSRPDLSPWLANVFVVPEARGKGLVAHLIAAVETVAREAGVPTLWLHTVSAERIYARAGWITVAPFTHNGKAATLMRRDLT